jgi:adenylate kinase
MLVVLLGPPGAGKGTQAGQLAQALGVPHVATGDILREALARQSDLGIRASAFMDRGELVPDDLIVELVRDRLAQPDARSGAVFDGFPRTMDQARSLDALLAEHGQSLDRVVCIDVAWGELIERMAGRRVCRAEGHNYHLVYRPPRRDGYCDLDDSQLYQRTDDTREATARRLHAYQVQTAPVLDFYGERSLLASIDGQGSIEEVQARLWDLLDLPMT